MTFYDGLTLGISGFAVLISIWVWYNNKSDTKQALIQSSTANKTAFKALEISYREHVKAVAPNLVASISTWEKGELKFVIENKGWTASEIKLTDTVLKPWGAEKKELLKGQGVGFKSDLETIKKLKVLLNPFGMKEQWLIGTIEFKDSIGTEYRQLINVVYRVNRVEIKTPFVELDVVQVTKEAEYFTILSEQSKQESKH